MLVFFFSPKNPPTRDETRLQITNPSQRRFHQPGFSSELQRLSLSLSFVAPCQQRLGTSIHSHILLLLFSLLSIPRCLKYHFSHILPWELNHLQLRDEDAAADSDGRRGDATLPAVKCAWLRRYWCKEERINIFIRSRRLLVGPVLRFSFLCPFL